MLIIDHFRYYQALYFLLKCVFHNDMKKKTFSIDPALSHIRILRLKGNSIIFYVIRLYYIIMFDIS